MFIYVICRFGTVCRCFPILCAEIIILFYKLSIYLRRGQTWNIVDVLSHAQQYAIGDLPNAVDFNLRLGVSVVLCVPIRTGLDIQGHKQH